MMHYSMLIYRVSQQVFGTLLTAFRPFKTNMKNGEAEYLKFDFLDDNVCFQMFVYGYWKKDLVHIESVKKKNT